MTNQELVKDYSQGPEVDRQVVRLLHYELRCHVKRRPLDTREDDRVRGHGPREAEVAQLDAAVGANEDVLRLHVAVDDAVRVQVVQGLDQLFGDLLHLRFRQRVVVLKDLEQLPLRVGRCGDIGAQYIYC